MTSDQELADALVALGIGSGGPAYWCPINDTLPAVSTEQFVRDWRVAGAVMEQWGNGLEYVLVVDKWEVSYTWDDASFRQNIIVLNQSLPRAIN